MAEVTSMSNQSFGLQQDLEEDPVKYNLVLRIVLGCLLILINTAGFIVNVLVLVVFHLSRGKLSTVSSVLIISLNVVDILITVLAIPLTLVLVIGSRLQYPLFCLFHEAAVSFSSSASAVGLLVITLDRYTAIVTPFNRLFTLGNVGLVVFSMWVVSLVGFLSPFMAYFTSQGPSSTDARSNRTGSAAGGGGAADLQSCFISLATTTSGRRVDYELYYVTLYLIANAAMLICYLHIFRTTRRRNHIRLALVNAAFPAAVQGITSSSSRALQVSDSNALYERGITHSSLRVVSTFMLCWGPHAFTSLLVVFSGVTYTVEMVQLCCLTLAYSSSALHPIIYVFTGTNFRKALAENMAQWFTNRVTPATLPTVTAQNR